MNFRFLLMIIISVLSLDKTFSQQIPQIVGGFIEDYYSDIPTTGDYALRAVFFAPYKISQAYPPFLNATIHRKKDNSVVKTVSMYLTRFGFLLDVKKYNPICSGIDTLKIESVTYFGFPQIPLTDKNEPLYVLTDPICCREKTDNMNNANSSVILRMDMAPISKLDYTKTAKRRSPIFITPTVLEVCKGQQTSFLFYAWNGSQPSNISKIEYSFSELITKGNSNSTVSVEPFKSGFLPNNFTGNTINGLKIDNNGRITGIPESIGKFTYVVKATAYQDTMKISEMFGEYQLIVKDCPQQLIPNVFASKVDNVNSTTKLLICQDSLIQLNAKSYIKGGTFQWLKNGIPVTGATDTVYVIRNNQEGQYSLRITNPIMCNKEVNSNSLAINFYPKPTANITASSPTGTLCQGGVMKLMGGSDIANVKYQWFRENVIVNNATNSIFDATESGNYTVKVTSHDGCVNISSPQNVVSNTPPKAEITTSNKVICKGKYVIISATSGTGNVYVWTRDGVTLSNNSASFTTNQTGKYSVKITAPNTCSTTSKPFDLVQVENPSVSIVNLNGTQLCQGSNATFTIKGNALNGFQWLKDGVKLTMETKNSLSVSQEGEYSVAVIDTNGCENTSVVEKITLVNKVIVKLDSIHSLCGVNNPSIMLTGTPSGGIFTGNGVNGNEFKSSIAGIGKHKITYTINGSLTCLNGTAEREIIVASIPTVTILNPNSGKICVGDKVNVSANIQNGSVFQWFKDNVAITGANQNTYQTRDAGDYRIEVSNANNCKAISDNFKVEIFPRITVLLDSIQSFCGTAFSAIPLIGSPNGGVFVGKGVSGNNFDPKNAGVGTHTITYKITRDPVCAGGKATRKVTITPPPILNLGLDRDIFKGQSLKLNGDLGNGYTYQWNPPTDLDNPLIPKPNAKPNQTTTYILKATGPNNCIAVDTITLSVVNLIYVPNIFTPNNDGLNDTWDISGLETYPEVEVSIYNRWGNLVYYSKGNSQKPFDGKFQDQLLPEDTYAYVINTNNQGYILKGTILLQR